MKEKLNRLGFSRLVLCAQTSGAQIEVSYFAPDGEIGGLNIGYPAPLDVALRMTHSITKLWGFSA